MNPVAEVECPQHGRQPRWVWGPDGADIPECEGCAAEYIAKTSKPFPEHRSEYRAAGRRLKTAAAKLACALRPRGSCIQCGREDVLLDRFSLTSAHRCPHGKSCSQRATPVRLSGLNGERYVPKCGRCQPGWEARVRNLEEQLQELEDRPPVRRR